MATCPNGHTTTAADYCDTCGAPLTVSPEQDAPKSPVDLQAPVADPAPMVPGGVPVAKTCPNCHGANPRTALFCEACGYDFTTGSLPRLSALLADASGALDLDSPVALPAGTGSDQGETPHEAGPSQESGTEHPPADSGPAEPADSARLPPVADAEQPAPAVSWVAEVWIDPEWYAGQDSPDQLPSPGLPRVVALEKSVSLIGRPSKSRGITPDIDCEPDTGVSRRHAELSTDGVRWWVADLGSSNGTFVGQSGSPLPQEPISVKTELAEDARVYLGSWTRIVVRQATPDELGL